MVISDIKYLEGFKLRRLSKIVSYEIQPHHFIIYQLFSSFIHFAWKPSNIYSHLSLSQPNYWVWKPTTKMASNTVLFSVLIN